MQPQLGCYRNQISCLLGGVFSSLCPASVWGDNVDGDTVVHCPSGEFPLSPNKAFQGLNHKRDSVTLSCVFPLAQGKGNLHLQRGCPAAPQDSAELTGASGLQVFLDAGKFPGQPPEWLGALELITTLRTAAVSTRETREAYGMAL